MDVAQPLDFEDLPGLFPELPEAGRWLPLLRRHAAFVHAAEPAVRVTSVKPIDFPRRHFAECLELLRAIRGERAGGPIIDLGSGGGFPGLVFAAIEPETEIHLVEPLQKRARLLSAMVDELGFVNVAVHGARAEDAARGSPRRGGVAGGGASLVGASDGVFGRRPAFGSMRSWGRDSGSGTTGGA